MGKIPNGAEDLGDTQRTPIKILLLKTPFTPAERQAVAVAEPKHQLLLAAKRGDAEGVRKLLQAGVKANTVDARGVPAIAWAAFAGDLATIKELLAAGSDVRSRNSPGHQAILIYLTEGIFRAGYLKRLGSTTASEDELREQRQEIVRRLIAAGAGINVKDAKRGTVLNRAINFLDSSGYLYSYLSIETVKALIGAGAKVNAVDESGRTPLMLAAHNESYEATRLLLESGAKSSINTQDKQGQTALIDCVARSGWTLNIAAALIAAGAHVNVANRRGQTPLMFAAMNNSLETVKILLGAGATASINAKDKEGATALLYATRSAGSAVVQALIGAGADVRAADGNGQTALMFAVLGFSTEVIDLLLESGVPIEAKDNKGYVALMYAMPPYHAALGPWVLKALLAARANVNAVDGSGQTALMLAAGAGAWPSQTVERIKLLLAAGADVSLKDNQGQTALMIARKANNEAVAKVLEEAAARH